MPKMTEKDHTENWFASSCRTTDNSGRPKCKRATSMASVAISQMTPLRSPTTSMATIGTVVNQATTGEQIPPLRTQICATIPKRTGGIKWVTSEIERVTRKRTRITPPSVPALRGGNDEVRQPQIQRRSDAKTTDQSITAKVNARTSRARRRTSASSRRRFSGISQSTTRDKAGIATNLVPPAAC